jgi:hypothetical protein
MTSRGDSSDEINWERVARAETHELRLSILELLGMDGGRTLSPKELTYELQERPVLVNYHIRELRKSQLIRLVHEHEAGGVIEHFYCPPDHSAADLFERLKRWHEFP